MSGSETPKANPASQAMAALRNIGIAAAVLVFVFIAYARYTKSSAQLKKLRDRITELMKHDTARDYREAAKLLDEGLAIRSSDPYFVSTRAEVSAILWVDDGYADEKANAEKYTAESDGINTGARFSAETLTLLGEGKLDEADSKLTSLVQKGITTPQIIAAIGELHLRQGKLEAAKSDFKQVQDIFTRYGAFYGEALYLAGELPAAQSVFARQSEMAPNHLRARVDRARADIARGERFPEAQKTFDELLPANGAASDDVSPALKSRILAGRAELALASGDAAAAEKLAKAAVDAGWQLDPQLALAHYDLGLALAQQKKAGAYEAFQAAVKQFQYIPRIYFQGALALAQAGDEKNGQALLDLYKTNGLKDDENFSIAKGDFLLALDKAEAAEAAYDEAIKKSNKLNPDAFYKKGRIEEAKAAKMGGPAKVKQLQVALDLYSNAIQLRERYPEAYRQQGIIFLQAGDEKAVEKFVTALTYFKDAHASKNVMEEFVKDTYTRLQKAGGKFHAVAAEWKETADKMLK